MAQFTQGASHPSLFHPVVLGDIPVGVDRFGEERLVPIGAGLGCNPLVRIVGGAQVGYRVAAATW